MRYGTAFALVLFAATLSSLNGLFVRSFEGMADWEIVFWRHLFLGIALSLAIAAHYRQRLGAVLRHMGWIGAAGGLCFGISTLLVTLALHNAPVADVMFVMAAVPFLTALLAWIALREPVHKATWFAMTGAITGIAVMVAGNLGSGNLSGTLMATGGALMVATFTVILRRGRGGDMVPMFAIGSFVAAAIALPFAGTDTTMPQQHLLLMVFWAMLVSPIYYTLFVVASRHIPGAELMLVLPLETIEAALLAWIFLAEIPTPQSFIGGAIVIASVSFLALVRIRRDRAA